MPSTKAKLRAKGAVKSNSGKGSPSKQKNESIHDRKISSPKPTNEVSIKTLQDVEKEHKILAEEAKCVREEHKQLLAHKDSELKMLDNELIEKEALLKEFRELVLDNEQSLAGEDNMTALAEICPTTSSEELDVTKLRSSSEKLIKRVINLRKSKHEYTEQLVNEMHRNKIFEEILKVLNVDQCRKKTSFGRIFLKNKAREYEQLISQAAKRLKALKNEKKETTGDCWEKAANKYGEKMRELMEEKGRLENEFLDKEEKLKELEKEEVLVDKAIDTKKAKVERHSEINRKQIFNSVEFKELMEHRDGLIGRIEKSLSVIEDTKEACHLAILKSNELYLNLLKTQKRVQELTTKMFELTAENEQERMKTIGTSAMMDYVSHELNSKNGVLLQLEVTIEELQNKKDMLGKNLNHCLSQVEIYEHENEKVWNRINELNDQYFTGAWTF